MKEREAILLKASGELSGMIIRRDKNDSGWVVTLTPKANSKPCLELSTKRGKTPRIFKTSDAAIRWCQKIGFGETIVIL